VQTTRILESWYDRLVTIVKMVDNNLEKRSEDEVSRIHENMKYSRSCAQKMVRLLLKLRDSKVAVLVHKALT
jgi:predicted transcriptional regulator